MILGSFRDSRGPVRLKIRTKVTRQTLSVRWTAVKFHTVRILHDETFLSWVKVAAGSLTGVAVFFLGMEHMALMTGGAR